MKTIILGGISPEYELAIQMLLQKALNSKESFDKIVEEMNEVYEFSSEQVMMTKAHYEYIKAYGLVNWQSKLDRKVESDRIFEFDGTIESIINSNYKFQKE